MRLSTNPGYREGTVPTLKTALQEGLGANPAAAALELADLKGALGIEGALDVLKRRVDLALDLSTCPTLSTLARVFGTASEQPAPGCTDFLTYR